MSSKLASWVKGNGFNLFAMVVATISLVIVGLVVVWIFNNTRPTVSSNVVEPVAVSEPDPITVEPVQPEENTPEDTEEFDAAEIDKAVQDWSGSVNGTAGVVVMSTDGEVLSELNPDLVYFGASIYKLYVAYEGYLQVDRGEVDPDEIYQAGRTRIECLDLMIRDSDSPCGERMMAELGTAYLNGVLQGYGLKNTNMANITTSAKDAALQLQRIFGDDLSASSKARLLESMEAQIYRDTFNVSFADQSAVYNKIGFRELDEYHDVAIVELTDGREIIISALTSNVGTRNIVELGTVINNALGT